MFQWSPVWLLDFIHRVCKPSTLVNINYGHLHKTTCLCAQRSMMTFQGLAKECDQLQVSIDVRQRLIARLRHIVGLAIKNKVVLAGAGQSCIVIQIQLSTSVTLPGTANTHTVDLWVLGIVIGTVDNVTQNSEIRECVSA